MSPTAVDLDPTDGRNLAAARERDLECYIILARWRRRLCSSSCGLRWWSHVASQHDGLTVAQCGGLRLVSCCLCWAVPVTPRRGMDAVVQGHPSAFLCGLADLAMSCCFGCPCAFDL
ncbi:hypothetical protein BS78_03G150500 [Paspalum vaginatum]|nr:hypothetical protein BS78_03G150500 [Paspalum vaginatum]